MKQQSSKKMLQQIMLYISVIKNFEYFFYFMKYARALNRDCHWYLQHIPLKGKQGWGENNVIWEASKSVTGPRHNRVTQNG